MVMVKWKKLKFQNEILKEDKLIIEDLIVAAHNNAKAQLKTKTQRKFQKQLVVLEFQDLNGHFEIMQNINEIEDLIKLISKFPGLGPKSAKRIVLKLINNKDELVKPIANTLAQVYKNIIRCNFVVL